MVVDHPMAHSSAPPLDAKLMGYCRTLVFEAAAKHKVPPVYVTAHVRVPAAVQARAEVMIAMIDRYGMKRWQVAFIFGRAKRRVRASVLRRQAERG